ncbi:olfactory receptor 52D1-like [Elephas maximus indicus]|uniref:olfactory receptor 52D1-like n=1 Tax=Elephas maximus indicus TaxID=99487 RepID=UPI0021169A83|nr:olfactory receptor 52D1-like [Elephas maximus indicus]
MDLDPTLPALSQTVLPPGAGPFVLLGMPGLEALHAWFSVPVCLLYMVALAGNSLVAADKSLWSPMYQLLGLLAAADFILATSTVPKALAVLWGRSGEISFGACLAQLFVTHVAFIAESSVLLVMAVDHYVAICWPLCYACCIADPVRARPHNYCEHMGVAQLACGDIHPNIWYGLAITLLSPALDLELICVSYALILQAMCQLPSRGACCKALGTCVTHASVIILFYTPSLFSFLPHRFGHYTVPDHIHILVANLSVVVPPALSPVVYGVRTQQITHRLRHLLRLCWSGAGRNVGPEWVLP